MRFIIAIILSAPAMHAYGLTSTTIYLTSKSGDVSAERADALRMTRAQAGLRAREWRTAYGVERVEVIDEGPRVDEDALLKAAEESREAAEDMGREHGRADLESGMTREDLDGMHLSGEWAGAPTPRGITRGLLAVDFDLDRIHPDTVHEVEDMLADAYDAGYYSVFGA